jgi:hypothetical protein
MQKVDKLKTFSPLARKKFVRADEGQGIQEVPPPPVAVPELEKKEDVPSKFLAGILFLSQGRILLCHKTNGSLSYWYTPVGRVTKDKHGMHRHLWAAAKDKASAVLGTLPPGTRRATRKHFYLNKKANTVYLTYVCEVPPGALKWTPTLGPDADSYIWASQDDAENMTISPTTKRVLENGDIWEGKFFSPINLVMEREATLGDLVQEGAENYEKINRVAETLFGKMSKDMRFTRLEMIIVGNSQATPKAGVSGVLHREDIAEQELFFDVSLAMIDGVVKIEVSLKKVGETKRGSATTPGQIAQIPAWVVSKLDEYGT